MSDISVDFPFYIYPLLLWLMMPIQTIAGILCFGFVAFRYAPAKRKGAFAILGGLLGSIAVPCLYLLVLR